MSKTLILDSSAVEHPAVNRRVVGSNPTRGVHGPLVKGLRHRPFTAVTRVRIPHGSLWRHSQVVRQRSATPLSPVQIRVAPLRKPWKDEFPGLIFPIKMYLLKTDFWKIGQHPFLMLSDRSGIFFRKQDSFTIINQMKIHGILSTQSVMLCNGSCDFAMCFNCLFV